MFVVNNLDDALTIPNLNPNGFMLLKLVIVRICFYVQGIFFLTYIILLAIVR